MKIFTRGTPCSVLSQWADTELQGSCFEDRIGEIYNLQDCVMALRKTEILFNLVPGVWGGDDGRDEGWLARDLLITAQMERGLNFNVTHFSQCPLISAKSNLKIKQLFGSGSGLITCLSCLDCSSSLGLVYSSLHPAAFKKMVTNQ